MTTQDPKRPTSGSGPEPSELSSHALVDVILKSQLNYRDLIDSLDHAVFTLSLKGEIRVANRQLATILDVGFPDLIGHSLDEFILEPTIQDASKVLPALLEAGTWQGRVLVRFRKDPQTRFYDCWLQLVDEEAGGRSVSGWARDVTPQHESEIRFAELFESLREGIFFTTPEGRLLDANPALVRMLGYDSKEELRAQSFRDRYAIPAQREDLAQRIRDKGSVQDMDILFRRKDGREIHCLASGFAIRDSFGQATRIQGTLVDITERIEFEERLRREQEFVRQLVANFPEMIAVLDLTGKYKFISSRVQDVLGRSPDQILGRSLFDLVHRDDVERLRSSLQRFASGELEHAQIEYRTKHIDGTWRILSASVSPLYDPAGRIDGIVATSLDVTSAKEAEKQKLRKEKLAAMGEMMSGVAHELNNPLTAILGVSDLIRDRAADDSTRRQAEIVLKQARRAAGIVQNLLAFSRPSPLKSEKIRPDEILRQAVEQHAATLRQKNITVDVSVPAGLPLIDADRKLLQQVFVNLIVNAEQAISAVRDHGKVRVSIGHTEGRVTFAFTDDGCGIPTESLGKIFDPFFTTKRPGGGTGLGLTICLAIAKEHGGTIEVESVAGEGSTFRVQVPASVEEPETLGSSNELRRTPAPARSTTVASALQGYSAYVVDDEESIREIVQEGLTARGMKVEGAASSEEALLHLASHGYDFVICDFNLPGQNGGQFFDRARTLTTTANTKFIFMTGALLDSEVTAAFTKYNAAMLQKPFHMTALVAVLTDSLPQTAAKEQR